MEKIPFQIVFTGKVDAYNTEHADHLLDEGITYGITKEGYRGRIHDYSVVVKTGDDILYGDLNVLFPRTAMLEIFKKHYREFVNIIFNDMDEFLVKPPLLFDKTDYLKVRTKLQKKKEYWTSPIRYGESDIEQSAREASDAIIRALKSDINSKIIGYNISNILDVVRSGQT